MTDNYYEAQYTKPIKWFYLVLGGLLLFKSVQVFGYKAVKLIFLDAKFEHPKIMAAIMVLAGIYYVWVGVRNHFRPVALEVTSEGIFAPRYFKRPVKWSEFGSYGILDGFVGLEVIGGSEHFPCRLNYTYLKLAAKKPFVIVPIEHTDFEQNEFARALMRGQQSRGFSGTPGFAAPRQGFAR